MNINSPLDGDIETVSFRAEDVPTFGLEPAALFEISEAS
jgi:hypothetical protein